jgi:predicted ABC-type exoprotein transport system permease subunit
MKDNSLIETNCKEIKMNLVVVNQWYAYESSSQYYVGVFEAFEHAQDVADETRRIFSKIKHANIVNDAVKNIVNGVDERINTREFFGNMRKPKKNTVEKMFARKALTKSEIGFIRKFNMWDCVSSIIDKDYFNVEVVHVDKF